MYNVHTFLLSKLTVKYCKKSLSMNPFFLKFGKGP